MCSSPLPEAIACFVKLEMNSGTTPLIPLSRT